MRLGTIAGINGGKVTSLAVGRSDEVLKKFRKEKFEGFEKVFFYDSGGRQIRKSGQPIPAKAPAKAPAKK
jgi:hypothetical protein